MSPPCSPPIPRGQTLTHFALPAPASATAGTAFSFTVAALDSTNHTEPGYSGAVHFTSTVGAALLPANATLTAFPAASAATGSST